jgi:group I intron endonuclease
MHIYKITNTINSKVYIGQTVQKNPKMRWYSHLADARRGKKSYLLDSIRKYGPESFVWEVIDVAASIEDLNTKEDYWLNYYRDQEITVYNNREAGGNKTHSPESIERMKESQRQAHARRRRIMGGKEIHKSHQPHKGGWNQRRVSCLCCKKNVGINVFVAYHGSKCKSPGAIL